MDVVCCLDSNYYAFVRQVAPDQFRRAFGQVQLSEPNPPSLFVLCEIHSVFSTEKMIFLFQQIETAV